nr:MAG TPA: hypothetical protein [Caudoviricetes sp.]
MEKILLPLYDMLKIKNTLESNIDVLKDKSVLVERLTFSEKNIPGYSCETEYIVDMCNNYLSSIKNRFSKVAELVVDIKNNKMSLDHLNKMKDTLPKNFKRLVIGREAYFSYDISKEEFEKSDRRNFTIVMEGFNALFKNEGIYDEAYKLIAENNFDNLSLQSDEVNSIIMAAESYYEDLVLSDNYDKLRYSGTQWLNKQVKSFAENKLPDITETYNKDNEKFSQMGEKLHIILQNYIGRLDKWVE